MLKKCRACLESERDTAYAPYVTYGDCDTINFDNKCKFFKYDSFLDRFFGFSSKDKKYCSECKYYYKGGGVWIE
jgi:hypothetical protein